MQSNHLELKDGLLHSKNMMHKANHECILPLGSSIGLTAPVPPQILLTTVLSQSLSKTLEKLLQLM